MKKIVRLTEKDLTKLVKRVMNEGVIRQITAEDFIKTYPNVKGTFEVKDGYFEVTTAEGKSHQIV